MAKTRNIDEALLPRGLRYVAGDGIAAPVNNLTAAVGASGALTGTYYYTLTFVTALGETAPWAGTPTGVSPSSQSINLTAKVLQF